MPLVKGQVQTAAAGSGENGYTPPEYDTIWTDSITGKQVDPYTWGFAGNEAGVGYYTLMEPYIDQLRTQYATTAQSNPNVMSPDEFAHQLFAKTGGPAQQQAAGFGPTANPYDRFNQTSKAYQEYLKSQGVDIQPVQVTDPKVLQQGAQHANQVTQTVFKNQHGQSFAQTGGLVPIAIVAGGIGDMLWGAAAGGGGGAEAVSGMDLAADAVAGTGNAVGTIGNAAGVTGAETAATTGAAATAEGTAATVAPAAAPAAPAASGATQLMGPGALELGVPGATGYAAPYAASGNGIIDSVIGWAKANPILASTATNVAGGLVKGLMSPSPKEQADAVYQAKVDADLKEANARRANNNLSGINLDRLKPTGAALQRPGIVNSAMPH